MSIKCMTQVWDQSSHSGSHLLLLIALADFANDDGICWPAIETLANKVRKKVRQTQYTLRDLETSGEIYAHSRAGRHQTNYYLITLGKTQAEIERILVQRLRYAPDEAQAAAAQVIALRNGAANCTSENGAADGTDENDAVDCTNGNDAVECTDTNGALDCTPNKGAVHCQKGAVHRENGAVSQPEKVQPPAPEPSCNRHENRHENRQQRGAGGSCRVSARAARACGVSE